MTCSPIMHWTNLLVDLKLWTITNTKEVEYENKPFSSNRHRKVSARAGRSGNDFRVREVNVWRAMLAQLASGSKCF